MVAAHLPLGSTWMYPVFCQCSKHKGVCRVCNQGAIVYLCGEVYLCAVTSCIIDFILSSDDITCTHAHVVMSLCITV